MKVYDSDSEMGAETIYIARHAKIEHQTTAAARAIVAKAQSMKVRCYDCKQTKPVAEFDGSGTDLCNACYDEAGFENEHNDTNGTHDGAAPMTGCPLCAK